MNIAFDALQVRHLQRWSDLGSTDPPHIGTWIAYFAAKYGPNFGTRPRPQTLKRFPGLFSVDFPSPSHAADRNALETSRSLPRPRSIRAQVQGRRLDRQS